MRSLVSSADESLVVIVLHRQNNVYPGRSFVIDAMYEVDEGGYSKLSTRPPNAYDASALHSVATKIEIRLNAALQRAVLPWNVEKKHLSSTRVLPSKDVHDGSTGVRSDTD